MSGLATNSTLTGRHHPDTSHLAALRALGRTGTSRRRVLQALVASDHTDEELQVVLAMGPNTQRPRRVELVDYGYAKATGQYRPTTTGSRSIVWAATDAGRHALALAQRAERLANPQRPTR